MQDIYEQIHELEGIPDLSKHAQLLQGIINAINAKLLSRGDALPSVNQLISKLGFARETITKRYKELVKRGIVTSTDFQLLAEIAGRLCITQEKNKGNITHYPY